MANRWVIGKNGLPVLVYCWIKGWITLSGSESELKAWHTSLLPDVGANKPCSEKPCRSGLFAHRLILNSWHNGKARNLTSCQHSSMFTHAYMEEALRVLPNKIVKMLWKWGEVPEVGPFNKTLLLLSRLRCNEGLLMWTYLCVSIYWKADIVHIYWFSGPHIEAFTAIFYA